MRVQYARLIRSLALMTIGWLLLLYTPPNLPLPPLGPRLTSSQYLLIHAIALFAIILSHRLDLPRRKRP